MATIVASPGSVKAFPRVDVEAKLLAELLQQVKSEAAIKGLTLPSSDAAIIKAGIQIDSLVTVDILITVEPILGFELPQHVVRTGGYVSIEAAMAHLMPRIEKQWKKKHGVTS